MNLQRNMLIALVMAGCLVYGTAWSAEEEKSQPEAKTTTETKTPETKASAKGAESEVVAEDESGKASEVKHSSVDFRTGRYKGLANSDFNMDEVVTLGEKLTFLAKWNGIPAGTITLRVWPTKRRVLQRKAYLFEMRSESNEFLSLFYEVNSVIKSFADAKTGRSFLFKRDLREGRYRANDRTQFDYDNVDADGLPDPVLRYSKMDDGEQVNKTPKPIPGPLQDPLSIAYYIRHLPFDRVGAKYTILMGRRKSTAVVRIKVVRFEKLTLPKLGTFECAVIEPVTDGNADESNLAKTKGTATIWLERNTRIPLMLKVDIPIGKATASLMSEEKTKLLKHVVAEADPSVKEPATASMKTPEASESEKAEKSAAPAATDVKDAE